jgi:hypothetical protein
MTMTLWMAVVLGIAVVALCGGVAWWKTRRARRRSQDPQNIYPLW